MTLGLADRPISPDDNQALAAALRVPGAPVVQFSIGDVTPGAYRLNASVPMFMNSGGAVTGGGGGVSTVSGGSGGGAFTSWSISSGGVTTTSIVNGTPQQPQEVTVTDADVRGVRLVARRPPAPQ